ncbi:D-arabinono-1,4-lactone oxidase [Streptomyces sp. NPDC087440]|uniref:D-arabinono-1,4-lactone oxidase n=1 Tax=Streptomyces sp. NPDC087440 TaxID=3365790 RepID=UPI003810AE77
MTRRHRTWRSWSRTQSCVPHLYARPRSEEEVAELLAYATERDLPVRAAGAGHSFAPLVNTTGVLVDMRGLRGVLATRGAGQDTEVTVAAGTSIGALATALAARGLAVHGLGTTTAPTVAGAVATGTHGGGRHPSLSAQVAAVRLATADGALLDVGGDGADRLNALRLSLGTLGVVTAVTLRCVPAHLLQLREEYGPLGAVLEDPAGWAESAEHVSAFWFPWEERVRHRTLRRTGPPLGPEPRAPRLRALRDDVVRGWLLREATARMPAGRRWRRARRVLARASGAAPGPPRTVPAHRGLVFDQWMRFTAREYAIPLDDLPAVLPVLGAALARTGFTPVLPLELRPGPAEDVWLSPAYGRRTAWINLAAPAGPGRTRWFEAAEAVLGEAGARPHWGKEHGFGADRLRGLYPRWEEFRAVREGLDPGGRFLGAGVRRVLEVGE